MYRQTWFSVTTEGEKRWQAAFDRYWDEMAKVRGYPPGEQAAWQRLMRARTEFREWILGWYRKLLLPMDLGDVVPNTVADLIAEEWDERTCYPGSGIQP